MIQLSAYCVVDVLQGVLPMFSRPSSSHEPLPPGQIWSALSHDVRTQVVGLLAQLTLQAVVARPADECSGKEISPDDQQDLA
jgi:hypothetical protein